MGADLYIKDMERSSQYTGFEVSEGARAKGYFRDCYNHVGLFSTINATLGMGTREDGCLSWWWTGDRKDLHIMRDNTEGDTAMELEGVKTWRAELTPIIEKFVHAIDHPRGKVKVVHAEMIGYKPAPEGSVKREFEYRMVPLKKKERAEYREWALGLLEFLQLAIDKKSGIILSV